MYNGDIDDVMEILAEEVKSLKEPAVTAVARRRDPYRVLISCIISLRTKDEVTGEASKRLYALADNPADMLGLDEGVIAEAIYPAGFYRNKARTILDVSRTIVECYGSRVPDDLDELLKLKGVGRKTANLVITLGFNKPGICVDTHVHRITNRWGYVQTGTPDETEFALREKLPKRYWIELNDRLVTYGQNICKPLSPHCSRCRLYAFCGRVGVERSR